MPGPAVELLHVRKTYREGDSERAVLSDVSVAIEPGEIRRPRQAERVASLQITPQQALRGRRGDPPDAALSRRAMPPDDLVPAAGPFGRLDVGNHLDHPEGRSNRLPAIAEDSVREH